MFETKSLMLTPLGRVISMGTPKSIIWIGTWRTLDPRRILRAAGAVHGGFHQVSLESWPTGQELRTLPIGQLRPYEDYDSKIVDLEGTFFKSC